MRKRNKGFTLVEFVVTIAVATIVVGGAVGFLMTGYNQYHAQTSSINLQYEAQLAMNQAEDLILNATNGIAYEENADTHETTLTLYNRVTDGAAAQNIVTTVVWKETENKLYLSKYSYDTDGSGRTAISQEQLMADYVSGFSVDLSDLAKKRITIDMDFSFDEKSYSTENVVSLRNNIGLVTDTTAFTFNH